MASDAVIVGITGVSLAVFSIAHGCWERMQCGSGCVEIDGLAWTCPFKNRITLAGSLVMVNQSGTTATPADLDAASRSFCAVGERVSASNECRIYYPYPDALSTEIMMATGATESRRMCGEWLGSGISLGTSIEYFSMAEATTTRAQVLNATASRYNVASTNIGKMHASCTRTVIAGASAMRIAAQRGYNHLLTQLPDVVDVDTALRATAIVNGHYCDTGVTKMAYDFGLGGNAFEIVIGDAVPFGSSVVGDALQLVGASSDESRAAEDANDEIAARVATSPMAVASTTHLRTMVTGATGRSASVGLVRGDTQQTAAFIAMAAANPALAQAHVKGQAAFCALSIHSAIETQTAPNGFIGFSSHIFGPSRVEAHLRNRRQTSMAISSLGRAARVTDIGLVNKKFDSDTQRNVSSATFSQLELQLTSSTGTADVGEACRAFVRALFPDTTDTDEFNVVVPSALYTRLQTMVETVRTGVQSALRDNATLRSLLVDPDRVAVDVGNTRVRIPGAPRGSWAGATRPLPTATFTSDDGLLVMAAKQARAVFLDRMSLPFTATNFCDGGIAMDALSVNAYIHYHAMCSFYGLGMLSRPWADQAYDDASLVSRLLYVVGHEFGHVSLNSGIEYSQMSTTLPFYDTNTHDEAIADVISGAGLIATGLVTRDTLCQHVAQLWCARVPPFFYETAWGNIHPLAVICTTPPPPFTPFTRPSQSPQPVFVPVHCVHLLQNQRGDYFCEAMRRLAP